MHVDCGNHELCDKAMSVRKEKSDVNAWSENSGEKAEQSDGGKESEKSEEKSCGLRVAFGNDPKT